MKKTLSKNINGLDNIRFIPLLAVITCTAVICYLICSNRVSGIGFPLDDAWIHQTYARNLAKRGEWAFLPDKVSSGSTSPLWSIILAAGYFITENIYIWTFILGGTCLLGIAFLGEILFRSQLADWKHSLPWMGFFLAIEWHLVWAAVSGMETLLFAWLILLVFYALFQKEPHWWIIGILIGSSVWVRPEGITLLGPTFFCLILLDSGRHNRITRIVQVVIGFFSLFIPYLFFNYSLSGGWWPNTYYAKQAEYAISYEILLLNRCISLFKLPLVGAGILILPGFVYAFWSVVRMKQWVGLAAFLWWFGYIFLYALRLPVVYQHGRYIMPSMPIYYVLSGIGMGLIYILIRNRNRWIQILRITWIWAIVATSVIYTGLGAATYARDVAIIETEMVTVAKWVAENTESDAIIGAHDIGALGYFGQRALLDLAGLISPEVIPFIRDEEKLAIYIDANKVDYLVTFPNWYPILVQFGNPVFKSGGEISPKLGGENIWVYKWRGQ